MSKYLKIQGSGSSFSANAIEQVQIIGTEVELEPYSNIDKMYVNQDTGILTSHNDQSGYLYEVTSGDVIKVYATVESDSSNALVRYGLFASSSVSSGDQASQYGWNKVDGSSVSPFGITISSTGYLMVTHLNNITINLIVKKVIAE